jgi:hypothetical protein
LIESSNPLKAKTSIPFIFADLFPLNPMDFLFVRGISPPKLAGHAFNVLAQIFRQ